MAELNFLSAEEIQFVREELKLSDLQIVLKADWGSGNLQHQRQIHDELARIASSFKIFSISHCLGLGGFVLSTEPGVVIGFDVEETHRVSIETARRICRTEQEFLSAPSPSSLWTAKEAAFKSLKGDKQPPVVSSVQLRDWAKINSQFETVRVDSPQTFGRSEIRGVVLKKSPFTLSFFVAHA